MKKMNNITIEEARKVLLEASKRDNNWKWDIEKIENGFKISWSYLEYCGEGDTFFLIEKDEDLDYWVGYSPSKEGIEMDKNIKFIIEEIVYYALSRY